jgi:RNA polymerase sigma-70 factor (ECF subfamily)
VPESRRLETASSAPDGEPRNFAADGDLGSGVERGAQPGPSHSSEPRQLDPQRLGDHIDRLYRAAWALCGSREDAEDLVQETFARVLARPRLLHSDDDLGYLLRVLRNTFLTSRRTVSRRPRTVAMAEDFDPVDQRGGVRPEEALAAHEAFAAIAALPPHFRDALVAVDVVGLSYREAAHALRTREATITSRLFRARQQVAARLRDPGSAADESARNRSPEG